MTPELPDETYAAISGSYLADRACVVAVSPYPGPDGTWYPVPLYFAREEYSVDQAAASLGLRVLAEKECLPRADIVAAIRGRSGTVYACVAATAN